MHEGKAIGFVCRRLSAQKSPDLDILAVCKHNQTVEISEKLALNCITRLSTVQVLHIMHSLLATPINHTYSCPCGFCPCT